MNGSSESFKLCDSYIQEILVSHFKSEQTFVQFKADKKLFCVGLSVFSQNNGFILSLIYLEDVNVIFKVLNIFPLT